VNANQVSTIEFTVDTIEKHLDKPLNLDELAKLVGISKYHLIRLFKSIADKSLMSYVRARRLSISLTDLIHTDMNILDIAMKYQFEYEQSYIRAFQNQFHLTPARYRRLKPEILIEHKIDLPTLKNIGQGFVLQPKIVIRPLFHVQGIKKEIIHSENLSSCTTNKLAMLFHEKYFPLIPNRMKEHIYLAMILYSDNPAIRNDYMPCVETSILNETSPPFHSYTIPLQKYAVFRYVGLHAPTEVTYKTLYDLYYYTDRYMESNHSFKKLQPYHFEHMDLTVCSSTYCEMDLYYPFLSEEDETVTF